MRDAGVMRHVAGVLRSSRGSRHIAGVTRWLVVGLALYACGGSTPPAASPRVKPAAHAQQVPQLPVRPKNTLYRDEVEKAKSAGLGHFFERIELEPRGDTDENGRMISFEGFQIVALRPAGD